MKKILWLCPLLLLMLAVIGCDDKSKDDDKNLGGQLTETTWESEVANYPFLANFPAYVQRDDGNVAIHHHGL